MEQEPLIPEVLEGIERPESNGGRPKGAGTRRYRTLIRAAEAEALPIVMNVIERAKRGDNDAAKIILDRIWPKPRTVPLDIVVPDTGNPAELRAAMHGVLAQVAAGEVDPTQGAAFVQIMREVLEAHRIQTIDPVAAGDSRTNDRELLTARLLRTIEERRRLQIAAAPEPEEPATEQ